MLPEIVQRAIAHHKYSKGEADFSVTELISPPQITHLIKAHNLTPVQDENIWALLGTGLHTAMERAARPIDISERRMFVEVSGKTISGQIDLLVENGKGEWDLYDYKLTNVNKVIKKSYSEWEKQLNIYKYLAEVNGYRISSLTILAFLRDWDYKTDTVEKVESIAIPIWDKSDVESYLKDRIYYHTNPHLAVCTTEDQWRRKYYSCDSITKANRVFDTLGEAISFCKSTKGYCITQRFSPPTRCKMFCPVSEYCDQYRSEGNGVLSISSIAS